MLETSSGHIKPAVTGSGVKYVGIAQEKVVGDGSLDCLVDIQPKILHKVVVTGVTAVTDIRKLVYLSNDNDLTLTRPDASTPPVGYVLYWYTSTSCDVRIFSGSEAELLASADSITDILVLSDQAANADADGEFQRNGSNISFYDGTTERKVVWDTLAQTLTNKTLTSPVLGTSTVLDQTTADYTLTWADPAAARAISIEDPLGTDVFVWKAATQTLTNKTLSGVTLAEATDVVIGTTTGSKIGTGATQKIGFYGATPIVQIAKASYNNWAALGDVVNALVALGLFDVA